MKNLCQLQSSNIVNGWTRFIVRDGKKRVYFLKTEFNFFKILQIRAGKEQYGILIKSVKEDRDQEDQSKSNYSAFDGLDPLQFNPFTEPVWQSAIQAYNSSMNYADQKTAQILKMHLRQAQSNPRQLLSEFLRYSDLIRREKVKNELTSER